VEDIILNQEDEEVKDETVIISDQVQEKKEAKSQG